MLFLHNQEKDAVCEKEKRLSLGQRRLISEIVLCIELGVTTLIHFNDLVLWHPCLVSCLWLLVPWGCGPFWTKMLPLRCNVMLRCHSSKYGLWNLCCPNSQLCCNYEFSVYLYIFLCGSINKLVLQGLMDLLCNRLNRRLTQSGTFSVCRCPSCHFCYRSIHSNVKYHCTLEDINWPFCQGSLEYILLIAQAAACKKWLMWAFFLL